MRNVTGKMREGKKGAARLWQSKQVFHCRQCDQMYITGFRLAKKQKGKVLLEAAAVLFAHRSSLHVPSPFLREIDAMLPVFSIPFTEVAKKCELGVRMVVFERVQFDPIFEVNQVAVTVANIATVISATMRR